MNPDRFHERRSAVRVTPYAAEQVVRARLRSGHEARLIDVSEAGALIECEYRLAPGSRVALQIFLSGRRFDLQGAVVRAEVVAVFAAGIRYRAAVRFEREAEEFAAWLNVPDGNVATPN